MLCVKSRCKNVLSLFCYRNLLTLRCQKPKGKHQLSYINLMRLVDCGRFICEKFDTLNRISMIDCRRLFRSFRKLRWVEIYDSYNCCWSGNTNVGGEDMLIVRLLSAQELWTWRVWFQDVHPFYADLMNVLYDKDHYKLALGQINTARHLIDKWVLCCCEYNCCCGNILKFVYYFM